MQQFVYFVVSEETTLATTPEPTIAPRNLSEWTTECKGEKPLS